MNWFSINEINYHKFYHQAYIIACLAKMFLGSLHAHKMKSNLHSSFLSPLPLQLLRVPFILQKASSPFPSLCWGKLWIQPSCSLSSLILYSLSSLPSQVLVKNNTHIVLVPCVFKTISVSKGGLETRQTTTDTLVRTLGSNHWTVQGTQTKEQLKRNRDTSTAEGSLHLLSLKFFCWLLGSTSRANSSPIRSLSTIGLLDKNPLLSEVITSVANI